MKKAVVVKYLFEGTINERENERGVLVGDKVFVHDDETGAQLLSVAKADKPNEVLVDLDADATNYLTGPEQVIDLMLQ
ncbi:hypothetical protein [Bacillus mesophilum]|uniref:Uncharacterized protein n=1 Tax=Bacillus mesophilum TaxID=1071718 RepID=A0A7V7RM38_9BACI|nr:hypothetical protein [Bacillus mesophilum]KAB2332925.1 hypothetical protein F7732_12655 [Bacillus mesophilum]